MVGLSSWAVVHDGVLLFGNLRMHDVLQAFLVLHKCAVVIEGLLPNYFTEALDTAQRITLLRHTVRLEACKRRRLNHRRADDCVEQRRCPVLGTELKFLIFRPRLVSLVWEVLGADLHLPILRLLADCESDGVE